jgi:hypothetical protein
VNEPPSSGELTLAYEALRAQATGALPATTPRGLALFLAAGCPTWIRTWQPWTAVAPRIPDVAPDRETSVDLDGAVVQVLTEMALGCQRKWTA